MRQKCLRRKCEAEIEAEERKKQADDEMWIDSYIRQRDRWEKEQRAKCETERAAQETERVARENRWMRRAEIKAKRRAAALAALERKARKAAGRSDGKRKRSSSETAPPDMSPQPRPRPPPRVPEAILESNGQPGAAERFLVRWVKPPKPFNRPESSWEIARKLPATLLAVGLEGSRAVFNRKVEPRLTSDASLPEASGVVALNVPEDAARRMCTYLQEHWRGGKLPLSNGSACFGYATYGKTLSAHDAQQQAQHTLLMTHPLLPILRTDVPGFTDIETFLTSWLHAKFGIVVELYFAHGLRQSPLTLKSTGFDVHQDTEDFPYARTSHALLRTSPQPPRARAHRSRSRLATAAAAAAATPCSTRICTRYPDMPTVCLARVVRFIACAGSSSTPSSSSSPPTRPGSPHRACESLARRLPSTTKRLPVQPARSSPGYTMHPSSLSRTRRST